jgi:hypothetical protein
MAWITNLKEMATTNWWLLIIVVVIIFLATKIAKSFIKWAIIVGLVIFVINYGTDYKAFLGDMKSKAWTIVEDNAYKTMTENLDTATYVVNKDGSFTVQTDAINLNGTAASDTVKVTYKGISFDVSRSAFINRYIEDVQK